MSKSIGFIAIIIIGLVLGKTIGNSVGKSQGEAAAHRVLEQRRTELKEDIDKEDIDEVFRKGYRKGINELIEASRDMYPIMVDSITELYDVSLSDDTLHYYYTITDDSLFELPLAELKQEYHQGTRNKLCNIKEIRQGINAGFSITHHYSDKRGREMMTITISKKDCL